MRMEKRLVQFYSDLRKRDSDARTQSESQLEDELAIFVTASNCTEWLFGQGTSGEQVVDEVAKAKMIFAAHAYSLLLSAWDSLLAGRYDSAMHNLRSVDESIDFLSAITVEPSLVPFLARGKLIVEDARNTIKVELDKLRPGAADEWIEATKWRWIQHKFAHPTLPTLKATTLFIQNGTVLVPFGGGLVNVAKLRAVGVALAESCAWK